MSGMRDFNSKASAIFWSLGSLKPDDRTKAAQQTTMTIFYIWVWGACDFFFPSDHCEYNSCLGSRSSSILCTWPTHLKVLSLSISDIHGRLVLWRIPVFINMWDYLVKEIIGYKEMENFCGWQGKAQLVETEEISLVLFDVVNTQLSVFCVLCSRTTCWWVLFVHHIVTY